MVSKNAIRWRLKQIWDISSFGTPLPYRLPYGSRWLLGRDAIDYLLFSTGDWEPEVWRFVDRFLRQGMTMLDVGAHHGFYTLLASKCVGSEGKVFAFEPAEPQRKKLLKHLRLNHCRNVQVEISALGARNEETDFFLAEGLNSGVQGLKSPGEIPDPIRKIKVPMSTLDRFLTVSGVAEIDLVKLDVEGAERDVLEGASHLLSLPMRPVFVCEVQDIRTKPWGYEARDILSQLTRQNYRWFKPVQNGFLGSISVTEKYYDGNFVAVPQERFSQVDALMYRR